jgi:hypothetical protein
MLNEIGRDVLTFIVMAFGGIRVRDKGRNHNGSRRSKVSPDKSCVKMDSQTLSSTDKVLGAGIIEDSNGF